MTPEAFAAFIQQDIARWTALARERKDRARQLMDHGA